MAMDSLNTNLGHGFKACPDDRTFTLSLSGNKNIISIYNRFCNYVYGLDFLIYINLNAILRL